MRYRIVDLHTRLPVSSTYACKRMARRRADQLDNAYGAYRYGVEAVPSAAPSTVEAQ